MMAGNKKVRRTIGDVLAIPLGDGTYAYGRVLREPLVAFYDLRSNEILPLDAILVASIVFTLFVKNYPITDGLWPVIGKAQLSGELRKEPLFFKKDALSGALTIYRDSTGEEAPASQDECMKLERAAVWEPHHVVDRLQDHFAGRSNRWLDSLRP
jgi:Immunity protein 26